MTEEHMKEFCQMESHANSVWSRAIDMADAEQSAWIQQMEMGEALLHKCGLNMAALSLMAADSKITAELYRKEVETT